MIVVMLEGDVERAGYLCPLAMRLRNCGCKKKTQVIYREESATDDIYDHGEETESATGLLEVVQKVLKNFRTLMLDCYLIILKNSISVV
jgi:hypothetical protein